MPLTAPARVAAQGTGTTGVLTGTVTERAGGTPIAGATVRAAAIPARASTRAATSNETGRYRLAGLTPGLYAVTATHLGYDVLRVDTVRVSAGETAIVNLALAESGVQLNQVVVTAGRARRRRSSTRPRRSPS